MKTIAQVLLIALVFSACSPEPVRSVIQRPATSTSESSIIKTHQPVDTPTISAIAADEQQIYSALIIQTYAFEQHTTLGKFSLSTETIKYIQDQIPNLDNDTLLNFQENNRQSYPLVNYLPANPNYLFLSDTELSEFYADWNTFSSKHPNLHAYSSFSRVGFNSSFTQALVLRSGYGRSTDEPFDYGGADLLYLFDKVRGKWIQDYQLVVSITG